MNRAGLLQLGASVLLLGVAWPLTRYAVLQGAGPAWFAFGRAALSGCSALLVLGAIGRLRVPGRRDVPALLALGLLQLAAFFGLAHAAVAFVPAGRTAILANAALIPLVPLSVLVLKERISARRWAASGLGLLGVLVLIGPWSIDWSLRPVLLGHGLLLGAATCWAAAIVIVRRFPPVMSMLALLPWSFGLASLALLPSALGHAAGRWDGGSLMALLGIGLLAGPVGTWCVMQAQQALPVVVCSIGFLLTPALGVILSAVWLHEALTWDILLGAALILGGAMVAVTERRG